ncbi:MAG: hypothetical protein LBB89_02045 [Treponema sp.]|jgi:hypothetical protein|nr:hypothetical protein [Treponema sp.]
MLGKINFQRLGLGCAFVLFCLIIINCTTTGNTTKNGIEGVWEYEGSYYGNKIILIFRDDKNGVMYVYDNRVSFQHASVKNQTLAKDIFQYDFSGNKIHFLFSGGKRYNNDCVLNKNGKTLVIDDFLDTLFSEYKFKKMNSKKEEAYLQMDNEKSGGVR